MRSSEYERTSVCPGRVPEQRVTATTRNVACEGGRAVRGGCMRHWRAGVVHLRLIQDGHDLLSGQLLAFDELRKGSAYFLGLVEHML